MGGPQAHVNSVESRALTHLESIGLGNAAFIPMGGPQAHGNSVESRALTHLESIGLGNAAFISMGGPQAHGNSQPARLRVIDVAANNESLCPNLGQSKKKSAESIDSAQDFI